MDNKVLYQHERLDNNKVFYVGIGNITRAYSKHGRNQYWKNVVNKVGYKVRIIEKNLTWEDACEMEKMLIAFYGRKKLTNMTDGGEGLQGLKHNSESLNKMKEARYKTIIDTNTNIIYKNLTELITVHKLKKEILRTQLNGITVNKTSFVYLEDYKLNIKSRKINVRIREVIDINDKTIYESISHASRVNGIPISTLYKKLNNRITNNTNLRFNE